MANRTVKDFEFPASFGFTGSGGKTPVKGYMRGGSVAPKKGPEARLKSPPPDIGWTDYKKGGPVKKADGGLVQQGGPAPGDKFSPEGQAAARAATEVRRQQEALRPPPPAHDSPEGRARLEEHLSAFRGTPLPDAPRPTVAPRTRMNPNQIVAPVLAQMARRGRRPMAKGGKVHDDKAEDVKLIRSEIKKSKGVPVHSSEPMIPMKKGGKACK